MSDKELVEDICREFKAMHNHICLEHLCKVYGGCWESSEEEVWMVMEYVEGGDLHNFIQKHEGPIPRSLQLSFFLQATRALSSLHSAPSPLLHKDIRPHNFLVKKCNNSWKLLLTDFGLSKAHFFIHSTTFTIGTGNST